MFRTRFERSILIIVVTLLGISWIEYSREPVNQPASFDMAEAPLVGHLAPDFTLAQPTGESVTLTDFVDRTGDLGRPVVLNFWASWCGPCRIETPEFQRASLKYLNRVAFLGVNQGEAADVVTEFGISFGLSYPLLVDQSSDVSRLYDINSLPTTVFIDRKGVVREMFFGVLSQATLEDRLNKLLAEN